MLNEIGKAMIVSDNTIAAEGLGGFYKHLRRSSARSGTELVAKKMKNPSKAVEIGAKVSSAAISNSSKAAFPLFQVL